MIDRYIIIHHTCLLEINTVLFAVPFQLRMMYLPLDKFRYLCLLTQVKVYPYHINDLEFATAIVDSFLDINKNNEEEIYPETSGAVSNEDARVRPVLRVDNSNFMATSYTPSDFPDAQPGGVSTS